MNRINTLFHIFITGMLSTIFFMIFTWNDRVDGMFLFIPFLCGMILRIFLFLLEEQCVKRSLDAEVSKDE